MKKREKRGRKRLEINGDRKAKNGKHEKKDRGRAIM